MLFKGKSSKLELLIEKIQANKENGADSETGSVANEGKWATTCSVFGLGVARCQHHSPAGLIN